MFEHKQDLICYSDRKVWVFSQAAHCTHDSQYRYNVILWHVGVNIVAMETQRFSFLFCTYATVSNVINTESVAMETEQFVLYVISLHISLPIL